MKQLIVLSVLTFASFFGSQLTAQTTVSVEGATTTSPPDSLEIFKNITDIEQQIQHSAKSFQDESDPPPNPNAPNLQQTSQDHHERLIIIVGRSSLDSIYARRENGTIILPERMYDPESLVGHTFRDTLFYNPLFLPVVFKGRNFVKEAPTYPPRDSSALYSIIDKDKTLAPMLEHSDFVRDVRYDYYSEHPRRVYMSEYNFEGIPQTPTDRDVIDKFNPFKELLSAESSLTIENPTVETVSIKRKYWIYSGNHNLHFSQNYFSDNWHKGGTSNLNINNSHTVNMNYSKGKTRFNNTLEWRLSLYNAPDDTVRSYRIGDDLIRYYTSVGIDAFLKKWSYSANLEAKSQLFPSYPANSKDLRSTFLAPLYVNTGIGLSYSLNKASKSVRHRNMNLSIALAPISINYKYVGNEEVNIARYGIPEGKKSVLDLGSTVTANMTYNFNRYTSWVSRLKYFTSYEKVESEFENTLNMSLNRFLSVKLYCHLRFDDGVPPDKEFKYFQFNETVSFGLNYKW